MKINIASYGCLNDKHRVRIKETLDKSIDEYPRTLVVRVDLLLPDNTYNNDSALITRFIRSLKAQIISDLFRRMTAGKRVHACKVRYVWAREFCQSGNKHYHVALFFNKDTYAYPGTYRCSGEGVWRHNLSLMIMESWVRALSLQTKNNHQQYYAYINFPGRGYIHLNKLRGSFTGDYADAINWISYLAKEYSKSHSDGQRNFGCSQY
ncbi:TPA: inovirus Gp2 family protein [Serratia marcescens]|nr:inovirus Gp2 family protein [Serratia marcescens]